MGRARRSHLASRCRDGGLVGGSQPRTGCSTCSEKRKKLRRSPLRFPSALSHRHSALGAAERGRRNGGQAGDWSRDGRLAQICQLSKVNFPSNLSTFACQVNCPSNFGVPRQQAGTELRRPRRAWAPFQGAAPPHRATRLRTQTFLSAPGVGSEKLLKDLSFCALSAS